MEIDFNKIYEETAEYSQKTWSYKKSFFYSADRTIWNFAYNWLKTRLPNSSESSLEHKLEYLKMHTTPDGVSFGRFGDSLGSMPDTVLDSKEDKQLLMEDIQKFYALSWPTVFGMQLNARYHVFDETQLMSDKGAYLAQLAKWAKGQPHFESYNPHEGTALFRMIKT